MSWCAVVGTPDSTNGASTGRSEKVFQFPLHGPRLEWGIIDSVPMSAMLNHNRGRNSGRLDMPLLRLSRWRPARATGTGHADSAPMDASAATIRSCPARIWSSSAPGLRNIHDSQRQESKLRGDPDRLNFRRRPWNRPVHARPCWPRDSEANHAGRLRDMVADRRHSRCHEAPVARNRMGRIMTLS